MADDAARGDPAIEEKPAVLIIGGLGTHLAFVQHDRISISTRLLFLGM